MSRKTQAGNKNAHNEESVVLKITVSPSYFAALANLGSATQKRISSFLDKLRNPTAKGLHIEPIDKGFVSIRANQDIRVIGKKVGETLILHYIDHHDAAYDWANKRKRLAEYEDGEYQLAADAVDDAVEPIETNTASSQEVSAYGKSVCDKLVRLGFPRYIARILETTQNEDELYERIEELPQHLLFAVIGAILDDIPYKKSTIDESGESDPIKPPSEKPATEKLPERQKTEVMVSGPGVSPTAGDLHVKRVKKPNSTMWLLQIYDGDTFIGSYERSTTEAGAKEKEIEILWPNEPDKRNLAAVELRKAYAKNGEKPFIVRWTGSATGQDDKKGVKQIKNEEGGELLGEFPRCCFRK